jgi:hypothetical protein
VTGAMMRLAPSGDGLGRIGRLPEEGRLRPDVANVYALQDAAQAWKDIAGNPQGFMGCRPVGRERQDVVTRQDGASCGLRGYARLPEGGPDRTPAMWPQFSSKSQPGESCSTLTTSFGSYALRLDAPAPAPRFGVEICEIRRLASLQPAQNVSPNIFNLRLT